MFKKLLIQLGVLTILGSNFLSPFSGHYINALLKKNMKKISLPEGILLPDVDGSTLKAVESTHADGLILFNDFIKKIEAKAKVVLQDETLLTKKLKKGANIFFVKIVIGEESRLATGLLINVGFSLKERIQVVTKQLDKLIDGSKLASGIKYHNIIKFVNVLAKKQDSNIEITLDKDSEANNELLAGKNQIGLNIQIDNHIEKHLLTITNVKASNNDFFEEILNKFIENDTTIDGSSLLHSQTIQEAFSLIQDTFHKSLPIGNISLVDTEASLQVLDNNVVEIATTISIGNVVKTVTFTVNNIKKVSHTDFWGNLIVANKSYVNNNKLFTWLFKAEDKDTKNVATIKAAINGGLYSMDKLTTLNTIEEAFKKWMEIEGKSYASYGIIELDPSMNKQQLLVEDVNIITVKMTSGTVTDTATFSIGDVTVPADQRVDNVVEGFKKEPINDSKITTDNTMQDVLVSTIKKIAQKYDRRPQVTLTNPGDASKKMLEGENIVNVTVSFSGVKKTVDVKFINVKLSDKDTVSNFIKKLQAQPVDGSSLTTDKTVKDAFELIKTAGSALEPKITVAAIDDIKNKLVENENTIKVKVSFKGVNQEIDVIVNKVVLSNKDRIKKVEDGITSKKIDGSSLTTSDTYEIALELIKKEIAAIDADASITLTNSERLGDHLVEDNNTLNVTVKIGDAEKKINVNIEKVKFSDEDRLTIVMQRFEEKSISGSILTTDNTVQELFEKLILNEINKVDPTIKVELSEIENGSDKLAKGDNFVTVMLDSNGVKRELAIKVTDVRLSDEDRLELFKEMLIEDYDGSSLTTANNKKDLLDLFTKLTSEIDPEVKILPVAGDSLADKLVENENSLEVVIKSGNVEKTIAVNFENVKLSVDDRLQKIIDQFKDIVIDGSSLTTEQTLRDAKSLLQEKIATIDPEALIEISRDDFLKVGDNEGTVTLKIDGKTKELKVKIEKVKLSSKEILDDLEKWLLEKEFDGSSLTTNDLIESALEVIRQEIQERFPDAEVSLYDEDLARKLTEGNNLIQVVVKIGEETREVPVNVTQVKLSDSDRLQNIIDELNNQKIDGSSLDTSKTVNDALTLIKELIKEQDEEVIVDISDPQMLEEMLVEGENLIEVTIKSGDQVRKLKIFVEQVKLSDKDKIDEFIDNLEDYNIDGSTLTTDKTVNDALALIQEKYADSGLEFALPEDVDGNKKLENKNDIRVLIISGTESKEITFAVNDVKVTDADRLSKVIAEIENQTIDGSDLTTDDTIEAALLKIEEELKEIDADVKIEFLGNKEDKLTAGDNSLKVKVSINELSQEIDVIVKEVKLSDNDKLEQIAEKLAELKIDGSSLTTDKKIKDITDLIQKEISDIDPKAVVRIATSEEGLKNLKEGTNVVNIIVTIDGVEKEATATIEKVKLSNDGLINKAIDTLREKKIEGGGFTTEQTYEEILKLVEKELESISPGTKVTLKNKDEAGNKLTKGENKIEIVLTSGDESKETVVTIANIKLSDEDIIKSIKDKIAQEKDKINQDLTTNNNIGEVVERLRKLAKDQEKDADIVTDMDLKQNLGADGTTLKIKITSGDKSEEIEYQVGKITLSDSDLVKEIQEKLKEIDGSSLTTADTKDATLPLANKLLETLKEKYNFDLDLQFPNTQSKQLLGLGNNKVTYEVVINGKKHLITTNVKDVQIDPLKNLFDRVVGDINKKMSVELPLLCLNPKDRLIREIKKKLAVLGYTKEELEQLEIEPVDTINVLTVTTKTVLGLISKKARQVRIKVKVGNYTRTIIVEYEVLLGLDPCLA